jgi:hypothetical protein
VTKPGRSGGLGFVLRSADLREPAEHPRGLFGPSYPARQALALRCTTTIPIPGMELSGESLH